MKSLTYQIGSTLIDLPDFLEVSFEEDDILLAAMPETDYVGLRFSVLTIMRDGKPVAGAPELAARKEAKELGSELHEEDGKLWFYIAKPSSEGSRGSLTHTWRVAMGAHWLIVSLWVDSLFEEDPRTEHVWDVILPAIKSFRRLE